MTTSYTAIIKGLDKGAVRLDPERARARKAKIVLLDVDSTDGGATFTVTLSDYNIDNILGILGVRHTTANSVLVDEAPTTSVSAGVLTITVSGSTATKKRSFLLVGEES